MIHKDLRLTHLQDQIELGKKIRSHKSQLTLLSNPEKKDVLQERRENVKRIRVEKQVSQQKVAQHKQQTREKNRKIRLDTQE